MGTNMEFVAETKQHRVNKLLKVLEPVMSEDGGVRSVEDVNRLVSLMKDMNKLESRCTYLNVILNTEKRVDILHQFVQLGGWKIMNEWLAQLFDFIGQLEKNEKNAKIKRSDFSVVIEDVLKALKILPVDLEILKQNATPRLVKNLSKDSTLSDGVQGLAGEVVQNWTDVIMREKQSTDEKEKARSEEKVESKSFVIEKNSGTRSDFDHLSEKESPSDKSKSVSKNTSSAPGSKVKLTGLDLWGPELSVKEKKIAGKKEKRKHDCGDSVEKKEHAKGNDGTEGLKKLSAAGSPTFNEGFSVAKKKKSEKVAPSSKHENLNSSTKLHGSEPKKHASVTPQSPSKPKMESSSMDILGQIQAGMDKTKNSDIPLKSNAACDDRDKTSSSKEVGLKTEKKPTSVSLSSKSSQQQGPIASKSAVSPKPKPQIRHLSLVDDMFKDSVMSAPVVKKKKKLSSAMGVKAKNVSIVKSGSSISDSSKAKVITSATAPVTKTSDTDKNIKTECENDNEGKTGVSNDLNCKNDHSSDDWKIGKANKKGRSIRWKEGEDLVLVRVYELDEEERAMKSVFSSTETDTNSGTYDNSNPMSASFFGIAKREMLLERKIRQQNNGSYSAFGPSQNYCSNDTFNSIKWVLVELTLSDDMKVNRGHMSTEKTAQTLREQSVPAEVYPNLLTVPFSPKEPNYDASAMFREKPPIIIPYDDIEPQGMEIDNDSEPEQDEDEKIFHELFPNASKKDKISSNLQDVQVAASNSQHGISVASVTSTVSPTVASNAFSASKTDPPSLQTSVTSSLVSTSLQTSNVTSSSPSVKNSTSGFNFSNDALKIPTNNSTVSSFLTLPLIPSQLPTSASSVANNTCPAQLETLQSVPLNNSSSVISPTTQTPTTPDLLQQPLNGLIGSGSNVQHPPNGFMPLNFNLQSQLPNNNTFPFAAPTHMGVSPPISVEVSPTAPLFTNNGPTMSNNLYPSYPSNTYPYNAAKAISPPSGGNMTSPMFSFPQNAAIPNASGILPANMVLEQNFGGNNPVNDNRSKHPCKYFKEGKCNHGTNCRFSHEQGRNDSLGIGNNFNYVNGSRNLSHVSNHKNHSNHIKPNHHHQQQRTDNSNSFSKHNNNNNYNNGNSGKSNDKNNSRGNKSYQHREKNNWKNSNASKSFSNPKSSDKKR